MKDYRATHRYTPKQWEDDIEWQGKRLSFIWDYRSHFPQDYLSSGIVDEKNAFYELTGDDVAKIAHDDHYSVDMDYYDRIYKEMNCYKIARKFVELNNIKESSVKTFFLKKNVNEYDYMLIRYNYSDLMHDYKEAIS